MTRSNQVIADDDPQEKNIGVRVLIGKLFSTGFFHVFGGSVINKAIGSLSGIILVRILTKAEYGTFSYAWNIYSMVLILGGMGMDSAIIQILSERGSDQRDSKGVLNFGSRAGSIFDLPLCIALLVIGAFVPLKISGGGRLLRALCLLPLIQFQADMILVYLRSQKRNQEYARISVARTAILFLVSASGALILRDMGLVIGNYAAAIASCLIGMCICRVYPVNRHRLEDRDAKRDILKIGLISMSNNALSQLLYLLDIFLIGILDPQETVLASYKVATIIPTALVFIPSSLITYIYPYFAEHKDDGEWCMKRYKQVVLGMGSFNLLISAFMFVLAPFILRMLFGEQYLDAVPVFRILAVNYFLVGTFRNISGNLLVTQRKLVFNLVESIFTSSVNIIADYILIQHWGSVGAAVTTLLVVSLSSVLSTVYLMIIFRRKMKKAE